MSSPLTLTLVLAPVPALALAPTLTLTLTLALTVALTLTRSTPSTTASTSQALYIRLQPLAPTVAASGTYGCSPHHLRLQPPLLTVAGDAPVKYRVNTNLSSRVGQLNPAWNEEGGKVS